MQKLNAVSKEMSKGGQTTRDRIYPLVSAAKTQYLVHVEAPKRYANIHQNLPRSRC